MGKSRRLFHKKKGLNPINKAKQVYDETKASACLISLCKNHEISHWKNELGSPNRKTYEIGKKFLKRVSESYSKSDINFPDILTAINDSSFKKKIAENREIAHLLDLEKGRPENWTPVYYAVAWHYLDQLRN